MQLKVIFLCVAIVSAACTSLPTPGERRERAEELASRQLWERVSLASGSFDFFAYASPRVGSDEHLTIYIEGDGFAWVSASSPSSDPTPIDPLALRLALAQPAGNVAYLARPCQFVGAAGGACRQHYWTGRRFAPEVIEASVHAVGALKQRFAAKRLTLVGYSGGAAVAALVAAMRGDVREVVTIAGNLDHRTWTSHHRIRALDGSLNAVDFGEALERITQVHLVGSDDEVIPPELARAWGPRLLGPGRRNLRVIEGFNHRCCWVEHWPALFAEVVTARR